MDCTYEVAGCVDLATATECGQFHPPRYVHCAMGKLLPPNVSSMPSMHTAAHSEFGDASNHVRNRARTDFNGVSSSRCSAPNLF